MDIFVFLSSKVNKLRQLLKTENGFKIRQYVRKESLLKDIINNKYNDIFYKTCVYMNLHDIELAVKAMNWRVVSWLFVHGWSYFSKQPHFVFRFNDRQLLHLAVRNGDKDTVGVLVENGSNVDAQDKMGRTPLMLAIEYGYDKIVCELLTNNADIYLKDDDDNTAISLACKSGNTSIVKRLATWKQEKELMITKELIFDAIYYGDEKMSNFLMRNYSGPTAVLDIEDKRYNSKSLLMTIVKYKHRLFEKWFLYAESKLGQLKNSDDMGKTIIIYAAENGRTEIIQLLIDTMDDGEMNDIWNHTCCAQKLASWYAYNSRYVALAKTIMKQESYSQNNIQGVRELLYLACRHGDIEFVKLLVEKCHEEGCEIFGEDCTIYEALVNACAGPNFDLVKFFIEEKNAPVKREDNNNWINEDPLATLLFLDGKKLTSAKVNMFKLLIAHGAEIGRDIHYLKRCSPEENVKKCLRCLLDKGEDINLVDNADDMNLLMFWVFEENVSMVKFMLDNGVEPTIGQGDGTTLIEMTSNIGISRMLLERYDINTIREDLNRALLSADERCSPKTQNYVPYLKLLKEFGAQSCIEALMKGIKRNNLEAVKELMCDDIFSEIDEYGETVLMVVKSKEMAEYLIHLGADLNSYDDMGKTPLIHIIDDDAPINIVDLFILKGAMINKQDNMGQTPLMYACIGKNFRTVDKLLKEGARFKICDFLGRNALMHACQHGHLEMVIRLVKLGADTNSVDTSGSTPLLYACKHNDNVEIFEYLVSNGAKTYVHDHKGLSALDYACTNTNVPEEIIRELLITYPDCTTKVKSHFDPLESAIIDHNLVAVRLLTHAGASVSKDNICEVPEYMKLGWNSWSSFKELFLILFQSGHQSNIDLANNIFKKMFYEFEDNWVNNKSMVSLCVSTYCYLNLVDMDTHERNFINYLYHNYTYKKRIIQKLPINNVFVPEIMTYLSFSNGTDIF
jgi:ankyrin repeat protein